MVFIETRGGNSNFGVILQISMRNEQNISTTIIQVQNMNLMLNMKDINKILAKKHFK